METSIFNNIQIAGMASAVPENVIDSTSYYSKFGKENVDKVIAMTGVKQMYISKREQTASDLAFAAAKKILENQNIPVESIGILLFITQTPDYRAPSTALVLHKRLGLSKDCIAFDINLGCSGFVYGMFVVSSLLQTLDCDYGMLLMGDTGSKIGSPDDRGSVLLFGDAGSAVLLQKKKNAGQMRMRFRSDGNGFKSIIVPSGAYRNMDGSHERVLWGDGNIRSDYDSYVNGTEVFNFTIFEVPQLVKEFIKENEISLDDYDCFALHQANVFILKQFAKRLKIPWEKTAISMDRYGNTSVSSIPLTLSDRYGDINENIIKVFMCGFGIGLSWGIVDADICTDVIYPILYTDDYYKDGGVSRG